MNESKTIIIKQSKIFSNQVNAEYKYTSVNKLKEWIEKNKVQNELYSDKPYEIDLVKLLKYIEQ